MIINTNMNALNAHRNMGINNTASGKSMEKLSSGLRINRAGDDAAGLAISEKMRGQIRGLDQASRNGQDGISMIQTAEGALNETHSILQRMRELSVQSSNDTNTDDDRAAMQKEVVQLKEEIDRISNQTEFNTKKLLNGTLGATASSDATKTTILAKAGISSVTNVGLKSGVAGVEDKHDISLNGTNYEIKNAAAEVVATVSKADVDALVTGAKGGTINFKDTEGNTSLSIKVNSGFVAASLVGDVSIAGEKVNLQIGANSNQTMDVSIGDISTKGLGVDAIDIESQGGAELAIDSIDLATKTVSETRANLGAMQNRLEHTINNLGTSSENLTAAESRVRDVDMAKEMLNFSKNNILNQAAQSMLAQAKSQPEGVLQLLR